MTSSSQAELVLDAGDELGAVVGEAAGLGRDQAGARDAARSPSCSCRRAAPRWCARSRHRSRRLREAEALAQPHDAREGVHDAEAVRRGLGDQQAAVVGAEIERRVGVPVRIAAIVMVAVPGPAVALLPCGRARARRGALPRRLRLGNHFVLDRHGRSRGAASVSTATRVARRVQRVWAAAKPMATLRRAEAAPRCPISRTFRVGSGSASALLGNGSGRLDVALRRWRARDHGPAGLNGRRREEQRDIGRRPHFWRDPRRGRARRGFRRCWGSPPGSAPACRARRPSALSHRRGRRRPRPHQAWRNASSPSPRHPERDPTKDNVAEDAGFAPAAASTCDRVRRHGSSKPRQDRR